MRGGASPRQALEWGHLLGAHSYRVCLSSAFVI